MADPLLSCCEELIVTIHPNGVAEIQLNRPKSLNALSSGMISEFKRLIPLLEESPRVRLLLIWSNFPKSFSSGGDVKKTAELRIEHMINADKDYVLAPRDPINPQNNILPVHNKLKTIKPDQGSILGEFFRFEYSFFVQLSHMTKPSIALISGNVMGGGLGLAMACTYRIITSQSTKMAMPETRIGLFPDVCASYFLPNTTFGYPLARYIALTGHRLSPHEMLHFGYANCMINEDEYLDVRNLLISTDISSIIYKPSLLSSLLLPSINNILYQYSLSPAQSDQLQSSIVLLHKHHTIQIDTLLLHLNMTALPSRGINFPPSRGFTPIPDSLPLISTSDPHSIPRPISIPSTSQPTLDDPDTLTSSTERGGELIFTPSYHSPSTTSPIVAHFIPLVQQMTLIKKFREEQRIKQQRINDRKKKQKQVISSSPSSSSPSSSSPSSSSSTSSSPSSPPSPPSPPLSQTLPYSALLSLSPSYLAQNLPWIILSCSLPTYHEFIQLLLLWSSSPSSTSSQSQHQYDLPLDLYIQRQKYAINTLQILSSSFELSCVLTYHIYSPSFNTLVNIFRGTMYSLLKHDKYYIIPQSRGEREEGVFSSPTSMSASTSSTSESSLSTSSSLIPLHFTAHHIPPLPLSFIEIAQSIPITVSCVGDYASYMSMDCIFVHHMSCGDYSNYNLAAGVNSVLIARHGKPKQCDYRSIIDTYIDNIKAYYPKDAELYLNAKEKQQQQEKQHHKDHRGNNNNNNTNTIIKHNGTGIPTIIPSSSSSKGTPDYGKITESYREYLLLLLYSLPLTNDYIPLVPAKF